MRKSSKAVSLVLAGLMATSCFSMAASAAEVNNESTGLAWMSLEERIEAGHQIVYFQFPTSVWGDASKVKWNTRKGTANVFCNFYAIYGNENEVKTRAWEAPSTSMYKDAKADTRYYFDITASGQGELEPGADYGILFSTKANAGSATLLQPNTDGFQTCDMYFNYDCLGDTYSVDEPATVRENTANSTKIDYLGHSSNGIGKPLKKISTLCAYIDGSDHGNAPKGLELANGLKTYLPNPVNESSFTWAKIQPTLAQFGTTSEEVYQAYVDKYGADLEAATPYEPVGDGSDLKADGTLKDVYRYRYTTYTEVDEATGVETEKTNKYPELSLVRERLNLPPLSEDEEITAVEATLGDGVIAPGERTPKPATADGCHYSLTDFSWSPSNSDYTFEYDTTYTLTYTFVADEGYVFTDDTTVDLTGIGEGSVALGEPTIDRADGNIKVTYTVTMPARPIVDITDIDVTTDAVIAPGKAVPGSQQFSTESNAYTLSNLSFNTTDTTFEYGKDYTLTFDVEAMDGYQFTNETSCGLAINPESTVEFEASHELNANGKISATFVCHMPAAPVTEIEEVDAVIKNADVKPGAEIPTLQIEDGAEGYEIDNISWEPADDTFDYGKTYTLSYTFKALDGYALTADTMTGFGVEGGETVEYDTNSEFDNGVINCTVTFTMPEEPVEEDTYIVAGSEAEIFGTGWDGTNEDNKMTKADDGTWTKDFTVDKAYDAVQLKTVKNGAEWIGDETGNNVTFNLTGAGTFTVVYDPETNVTSVKGDNVDFITEFVYETVYAVGNGEGYWLNGASWDPAYAANEMTQVSDGVWEIEFQNVPDGFERQIKFAIDGAWTHNFGAPDFEDGDDMNNHIGEELEAKYNSSNITFDTEDVCTVKAQLDLRNFDFAAKTGAKFTLDIIYDDDPVETTDAPTTDAPTTDAPATDAPEKPAVGIIGDVDGSGTVTINDVTEIQRRSVELVTFDATQEKLADVNGDGRVSILDVTAVQKYLAEQFDGAYNAGAKLLEDGTIVPAN